MIPLPDAGRPTLPELCEAGAALISASLRLRLQPLEKVMHWATGELHPAVRLDPIAASRFRRALLACCRRLPWRTLCLEQGIAMARLLSTKMSPVTLYYGAAQIDNELQAHLWATSRDYEIIGCENAGDFAILSQFSNDSSSSAVQP